MDRKVWIYYQKSYKREKLQNSMKLVSTVSPANFEHRLHTSLEGIATSSLAHAKNKSGRLEIRNIANVNTRQMKTRSQRNFCHKKHDFVQKNRRPPTTWNDKKSAILKDTIKNVFKLLLWSTHVNYIWVYYFFYSKEFAILKQVVDKKLRHRLLTFCLTIHMHCIFLFIFILLFNAFTKLCTF